MITKWPVLFGLLVTAAMVFSSLAEAGLREP
jgi:hypothetical protein